MGRCPLHAAQDALGVEDVRGWQSVGNDWTFEREIARADAAAGTERVLVVAAHVAAQVEGHADVRSVVWLPDGRAEVTFIDHEASVIAPAKLVPMGLLATDEAMRDVLVNRETWTRWQWRGDAHKARTARTVCRTCRATYSAQRTTPHTCGERLDSRGRALVSDTRKVGLAALGRARFALMRGKAIADADRAAIEAAGLEVPA